MKRILLVSLNSSWSQSNLAMYYLRQMMADLSYEVNLRSYTLKEPLMQVLESIWKMRPDVVCFSAYIWNRLMICELITELVKLLQSVIVVVGGPEAHNIPEQQNCILIHNEEKQPFANWQRMVLIE
jgi:hypothetical protein